MIYFLVNNNYQLYDAREHLASLGDVSLLVIPHSINSPNYGGFKRVHYLDFHFRGYTDITSWVGSFQLRLALRREFTITDSDVLFFYTEFEPMNHVVASHFKKAGARIFIIEDGGFATYVPFRSASSEPLTLKERLRSVFIRLSSALPSIRFQKINGVVFPWLPDSLIDGVCLYRPVSIRRKIPTYLIKRSEPVSVRPIAHSVIFLNADMYKLYQTEDEYLSALEKIMDALCGGFETVYFKYHPRETEEWRDKIFNVVLIKHRSVVVITNNSGIEDTVEDLRPAVVASFFSAALLSLKDRGVEPLYLYHLFNELNCQPIFVETTSILQEWCYKFPNWGEVSSDYQSGLRFAEWSDRTFAIGELLAEVPLGNQ